MDAANRRAQEEVFARTKAGRQAGKQAQEANTSEGVQETRSGPLSRRPRGHDSPACACFHGLGFAFMGLVSGVSGSWHDAPWSLWLECSQCTRGRTWRPSLSGHPATADARYVPTTALRSVNDNNLMLVPPG